ncbi:hypothetical protein AK812_SmicGene21850 [Symbiodinium microadriaticum]|uniref:Uncharacterized protein n=1 Tax=Symbiodinium microadriaticum TaxID=2951 RepID=A0A1Q9DLD7_SYMMI|nr:hypothetical protein AK812_SmicGene21850 [Symbiodinium microadriaticum]
MIPTVERDVVLIRTTSTDRYIDANNMRSFFFGHRPGRVVQYPARPQFDLHLLLALTVKYSLHPLSVEDVIEQCPTKIDRLGANYFLAIELLTLVDNGQGPKEPLWNFILRLITVTQTDRKFSEDWPVVFVEELSHNFWTRLAGEAAPKAEGLGDHSLMRFDRVVDLCADELVTVTRAFLARLSWLEEDLRTRGDESLLDLGEAPRPRACLIFRPFLHSPRSLQRVVRRASEYQDLHTTGSSDYWKDCADHLEEAYDDAVQMKVGAIFELWAPTEQTMERGQALEMQGRHDEAAGQATWSLQVIFTSAEKLNSMLFFLTAATALFTPVQFMLLGQIWHRLAMATVTPMLAVVSKMISQHVDDDDGSDGDDRDGGRDDEGGGGWSSVYGMNFVNVEGVPTIPMLLQRNGYERFWIGVTGYFALAFSCAGWLYRRLQRKSGKARRKAAPGDGSTDGSGFYSFASSKAMVSSTVQKPLPGPEREVLPIDEHRDEIVRTIRECCPEAPCHLHPGRDGLRKKQPSESAFEPRRTRLLFAHGSAKSAVTAGYLLQVLVLRSVTLWRSTSMDSQSGAAKELVLIAFDRTWIAEVASMTQGRFIGIPT